MTHSLLENAHAVLFPAFDHTGLSDAVKAYLDRGGLSILLGESRAEYLARGMSAARRGRETAATFQTVTAEARSRSGLLLAAVDQELGGICRLHDLVPPFPARADLPQARAEEIEALAQRVALAASAMGVNLFLSPILDVLDGENPWLRGRTWSVDVARVADLSAAYIRGVQSGGVAATGKHFPGFRSTTGDPAVEAAAESLTPLAAIEAGLLPFRRAVEAGVEVMMVGPAPLRALDPGVAALRSAPVIRRLTGGLGFEGVVMADDLDSQATMRGDAVPQVAIEALNAGCDFLLLADLGDQIAETAAAIVTAVETGQLAEDRLDSAAGKMRALACRYATPIGG